MLREYNLYFVNYNPLYEETNDIKLESFWCESEEEKIQAWIDRHGYSQNNHLVKSEYFDGSRFTLNTDDRLDYYDIVTTGKMEEE